MRTMKMRMGIALLPAILFCQYGFGQRATTDVAQASDPEQEIVQTVTLPCFFQTAVTTTTDSYVGNGITHDNAHLPKQTEVDPNYYKYGNNGFIFDGPLFYVGTSCVASQLAFVVGGNVGATDSYQQHCICVGGTAAGQGCTDTSSGVGMPGSCPGGGTATMYHNTYDVGLYCMGGGNCTYGQLYASIGPTDFAIMFAAGKRKMQIQPFSQGTVTLPPGNYAIGMATNCDAGSIAGTGAGGSGGQSGGGGTNCGQADGEGGPYNTGQAANGGWKVATELLAFKYFPLPPGGRCLLYDPAHDNRTGLAPSLSAYDNQTSKGCTVVNDSVKGVTPSPDGQAPHIINYVIW